jgi:hypothetical protein
VRLQVEMEVGAIDLNRPLAHLPHAGPGRFT